MVYGVMVYGVMVYGPSAGVVRKVGATDVTYPSSSDGRLVGLSMSSSGAWNPGWDRGRNHRTLPAVPDTGWTSCVAGSRYWWAGGVAMSALLQRRQPERLVDADQRLAGVHAGAPEQIDDRHPDLPHDHDQR
jgi:hypothetical protein